MSQIDVAKLKQIVSMEDVLRLIGWSHHHREWKQLYGVCPLCGAQSSKQRMFAVKGDGFYCFGCIHHGDQIRLYQLFRKLEFKAACRELCARLYKPVPYVPRLRTRRPKGAEERLRHGGPGGNPPDR